MHRSSFLLFVLLLLIFARALTTPTSAEEHYKSDIARVDKRDLDRAIDNFAGTMPTGRDTLTSNDFPANPGAFQPGYGGNIDGLVERVFESTGTLAPTATPTPTASPIQLILDESGPDPDQAAALVSVLYLRDPFPIVNTTNLFNQGTDKNSRIIVFATNIQLAQGETVLVNLVDSNNQSQKVTAEDVRPVPNFDFSQVIFRLPDNLAAGTCTIRLKAHGEISNPRTVRIRATPFTVTIDLAKGLITFPNKYSGWQVGGGSATNFVAYPSGWTVGGGSATNFVALPPGWTVGGQPQTNFVAVPPGWTVGGQPQTNFVAVPPGWNVGGQPQTNFVALPPGWTAGGQPQTNFVALPPGWTTGGQPQTNFVAVPPGWVVGGGSATNFVTYPGSTVTSIQIAFNDPGFVALFQKLQAGGTYSDSDLADIIMAVSLNTQPFYLLRCGPFIGTKPHELAPAGQW